MSNIVKFSTKVLVASALMSSVVLAEDIFVGVEGAFVQSKVNLDSELNEAFSDPKDGAFEFGFKAGQDFGDYRLWAGYFYRTKASEKYSFSGPGGYVNAEINWKSHNFVVGADYTPSITENFKALLGAYTGLAITKSEVKGDASLASGYEFSDSGSETDAGALIGLRLGGIYAVDANNEIEFGIKGDYIKTNILDIDKATNYGVYVGYNYKF
ncbi:putative outer membrane protein [Campylobacter hyointestinalis subsp. hyointestinalis]|uniref:Outer membrane protein n=1 Tax=Campylobacter hyointestinalis subsp. hyointestinalis TaxID=91352 RepID=A0A9W5ETV7_CAMHY|nr:hypothetical protein [Campylobacter hyointestinalis]CUU74471.1 putative outer membrane protein [Campylobacter hyointestinalis subsp. hyointestinalis]CUU77912.1 putative outer membrane protein [Campylobacter hyointestinalis subsp. hyointestinalis]